MAYMNQEKKKRIAAELKKVMPKNWKYSLSVQNYSTIVLTIRQAPIDLVDMVAKKRTADQTNHTTNHDYLRKSGYVQVNPYYLETQFEGKALKILEKAKAALYGCDYFDESDLQTDYFYCAYYVNINIGKWDKPFVCVK